ncbi:hypothetical protein CDD83_11135 [Cordyceps sp. RAO-2017]|nr:hypothetical protein CDD83_11135 [Cordyceps sp. RAO-2017]
MPSSSVLQNGNFHHHDTLIHVFLGAEMAASEAGNGAVDVLDDDDTSRTGQIRQQLSRSINGSTHLAMPSEQRHDTMATSSEHPFLEGP